MVALSRRMTLVPGCHGGEVDYGTETIPPRFIFVICVAGFYHVSQHVLFICVVNCKPNYNDAKFS